MPIYTLQRLPTSHQTLSKASLWALYLKISLFCYMTLSRGVIGPVTLENKGSIFPLNVGYQITR